MKRCRSAFLSVLYASEIKVEVEVDVTCCQGTPSSRAETSARKHLDFQRVCRYCRSEEVVYDI